MSGYEPVTLADYCNTGTGIYGENKPKTGRQVFHGLPFEIGGADSSRALLGFGEGLAEDSADRRDRDVSAFARDRHVLGRGLRLGGFAARPGHQSHEQDRSRQFPLPSHS